MFKNILHHPENVTEAELTHLDQRRKLEKQLILDKDGEDEEAKGLWFIVSNEWLFKWKCFVSNKISSSASQSLRDRVVQSENPSIGVLPPGPI
mmetsp:Transcript_22943/g.35362  ORF Transcript_22943/g.35362 Transcript_22943/m.35362 type:complete len:93 (+) Transcript_22943:1583-1861(+)